MKQKVLIIATALFFLIVNTSYFWEGKFGFYTTTLKLKDNNKFVERSICFGMHEVRGDYELKGDTILFKDVDKGREEEYYTYALIRSAGTQNGKMSGDLVLYKSGTDTSGYPLFIVKNELKK